jgi:hypothetical protein
MRLAPGGDSVQFPRYRHGEAHMRLSRVLSTIAIACVLAACGQAAAPNNAEAQPAGQTAPAAPAANAPVSEAEKTAILAALHLRANPRGLVMNACNDLVAPQYVPVDVGVGRTVLFAMVGGPSMYTCYGDGPDLHLMQQNGAGWTAIYENSGGFMVVLPSAHRGARDLAFGGPGFEHGKYEWNGTSYVQHGAVGDEALANAQVYPQ